MLHDLYRGFSQNVVPAIVLVSIALLICLSYYFFSPAGSLFNAVGRLKESQGFFYAFWATALFGGIIPFLYLVVRGEIRCQLLLQCAFYTIFWGLKGIEVDLFYRMQSILFGNSTDLYTVLMKTLVDQFGYAAFWAAPTLTIAYTWKDSGFCWQTFREQCNRQMFTRKIPVIVMSNWIIWLPSVAIIYLMPPALQLPLFNLVICFFVLVVSTIHKNSGAHDKTTEFQRGNII